MSASTTQLSAVFASNCRRLRTALGHTQQSLADEMGIFRARVAEVEKGVKDFKLSTVEQFAVSFNRSPGEMLSEH